MTDEIQKKDLERVFQILELDLDGSQEADQSTACPLHEECRTEGAPNLVIDKLEYSFKCKAAPIDSPLKSGTIRELRGALERMQRQHPIAVRSSTEVAAQKDTFAPGPVTADNPKNQRPPSVAQLKHSQRLMTAAQHRAVDQRRRGAGERSIIVLLSLVFVIAGLMAAGLSGFANYQAFASTVTDPLESTIWGTAGIIAAIVSFGGFTFVYWHAANKRMWESLRSLVFALVGAGASILGTQIYISSNNLTAAAEFSSAATNRDVLETQLADWRRQLEGIPPETRSVEGLEAYIAEVERVGRTEQKPYRDAQNELGLARRRDDLNAKIEAANAELLGQGSGNILLQAEQRAALPSWLFAVLLELFSSQATSIGLVALLILTGRRKPAGPD